MIRRPRIGLGAFSGILLGAGLAVLLQQAGAWQPSRPVLFSFPALIAIVTTGLALASPFGPKGVEVRRFDKGELVTLIVWLVIHVAVGIFGLTGFAKSSDGLMTAPCTISADSGIDRTTGVDTSASDPFNVDPDGQVVWAWTTSGAIQDHTWNVWVDLAGFEIRIDGGRAQDPEDDAEDSGTDVVADKLADIERFPLQRVIGSYRFGGELIGTNGMKCDAILFARISANPLLSGPGQLAFAFALLGLAGTVGSLFSKKDDADG